MAAPAPRILVADDEELMRLKLKRFLEKDLGAEVLLAADGEEAWRMLSQQDIRFVISDWVMKDCDGPELCSRIRALPGRPYTYFILLTGRTEQADLLTGLASGADDYLRKPVNLPELKSRVKAGMRVLELERSLERKHEELAQALGALSAALRSASRVQQGMLPTKSQLEAVYSKTGLRLAYNCQFCQSLGGDVLGLAHTAPDTVALFLADVSGHGIAAAVSAVSLYTYIQACLRQTTDPRELISQVNTFCCEEFPEQVYASMIYLLLHPGRRRVSALIAGHPPLLLSSADGSLRRLEATIPPLGLFASPPQPPDVTHLELAAGQRLVIYTDGIIETRNRSGEFFSLEQLEQSVLLAQNYELDSLPDWILYDVAQWRGQFQPVDDDMTVLALQFEDAPV